MSMQSRPPLVARPASITAFSHPSSPSQANSTAAGCSLGQTSKGMRTQACLTSCMQHHHTANVASRGSTQCRYRPYLGPGVRPLGAQHAGRRLAHRGPVVALRQQPADDLGGVEVALGLQAGRQAAVESRRRQGGSTHECLSHLAGLAAPALPRSKAQFPSPAIQRPTSPPSASPASVATPQSGSEPMGITKSIWRRSALAWVATSSVGVRGRRQRRQVRSSSTGRSHTCPHGRLGWGTVRTPSFQLTRSISHPSPPRPPSAQSPPPSGSSHPA